MLRYNVKLGSSNMEFNEIPYYSLFFSHDKSYISGLTSSSYDLINNQDVYIKFDDSNDYYRYKIELSTIVRRGYVLYNQSGHEIINFDENDFIYKDNNGINIGDFSLFHNGDDKFKVWCENNVITINGIDYDVDFDINSDNVSITLENGEVLYLEEYIENGTPKKETLVKFIIRKNFDFSLEIDNVKCVDLFNYILVLNDEYSYDKLYLFNDNNGYYLIKDIGRLGLYSEKDKIKDIIVNDYIVTYNGKDYNLLNEWRNVDFSDKISLELGQNSINRVKNGDIINVIPISSDYIWLDLIDDYVLYMGEKYFISNTNDTIDYIMYNGTEYELHYEDELKSKAYININDNIIIFDINRNKHTAVKKDFTIKTSNEEYNILLYKYIEINGIKHKVITKSTQVIFDVDTQKYTDSKEYRGIKIQPSTIQLIVENVIGSNNVICGIFNSNFTNLTSDLYLISKNYNNYNYELYLPLFDTVNYSDTNEFLYHFSKVLLLNANKYYNLPIQLNNKTSNNIHQEYLTENFFFYKEIEKSINRIVDMEKDVYYPYYYTESDDNEVDEIVFDLHFRSRNMDDWTINDDNKEGYLCNWNILDNYRLINNSVVLNSDNTKLNHKPLIEISSNDFNFYQPSDLLYYLNFTDKDIYYQKQKVGKSFLRLSFFDSNDPKTQSLLHTSTIFLNEGELYKKYIDNRYLNYKNEGNFLTMDYNQDENGVSDVFYDDSISVKDEYYKLDENDMQNSPINDFKLGNGEECNIVLSMDESKRLSSRITVKNRYNSTESSEGFYLYMFKEYSNKNEIKDIYLKIEFNHAGTGKVINMFMPTNNDSELLEFNENNIKALKEGIALKDLYSKMFIKLQCSYDNEKRIYKYYLPSGLVKHNKTNRMWFNLYEIKIKDELIFQ